ncbi:hypothetical protein ARAM_005821 [Aspergillus rambellii]|uniref:Probable cytosolic iron-sulfur protein assembly protein 1 n=1 Tax=Aspergillus rambellii TaxID=308745 RepID=A0A0F8UGI3_9EURO|nr:hypothetical protein ARAM_005821 [Aspergillus rambellii]
MTALDAVPAREQPQHHLTLLSDLTPPSLERTWLTAPHPTLPLVATCSSDKTVRVYSLINFRLLSTISGGHKRSVRTCAWKPNIQGESVLATGSFDATVGIWRRWDNYGQFNDSTLNDDNEGRQPRHGSQPGEEKEEQGDDNDNNDDDDEEWRFAVLLDGHDSEVKSVSWSASGLLLATCSRDKSIWIWEDLDDGDNNFETVAVMQEHEGDVKVVCWHPAEECLASASYDDTIRLWREDIDDWGQVACIRGHGGTVWGLDWEAVENIPPPPPPPPPPPLFLFLALPIPLVTTGVPKERPTGSGIPAASAIPSIIRPTGTDEIWEEDTILPRVHELSVYAVAWSKKTGLLASVGADGRIVVYEERFVPLSSGEPQPMETDDALGAAGADSSTSASESTHPPTDWKVIAIMDGAHGIYEINHVAWANRADRGREEGKEEEVLVTTADDGSIKVWTVSQ